LTTLYGKDSACEIKKIHKELTSTGYCKFNVSSEKISTLEISELLGNTAELYGVPTVQKLCPKNLNNAKPNTYSGNYGLNAFPLHTDMAHWSSPPHYLLLRCAGPATNVKTLLLDLEHIINTESKITLNRALFRPRRSLDNKTCLLRLTENNILRWDELFLSPVNQTAKDLSNRILEKIKLSTPITIGLTKKTECIIIDNWRALHGRTPVVEKFESRIIDRVYLSSLWDI